MSISDRLDKIEARADRATEGPWGFIADTNLIGMTKEWRIGSSEAMSDVAATPRFSDDSADAEFIAASRSDVPDMLAALRAVLDRHKPFTWTFGYGPVTSCMECAERGKPEPSAAWPCPTVRAVATALGQDTP